MALGLCALVEFGTMLSDCQEACPQLTAKSALVMFVAEGLGLVVTESLVGVWPQPVGCHLLRRDSRACAS